RTADVTHVDVARAGDTGAELSCGAGPDVAGAGDVDRQGAGDVGDGPVAAAGVVQRKGVAAADVAEHRAAGADVGVHRGAYDHLRNVVPVDAADVADVHRHARRAFALLAVDVVFPVGAM